MTDKEVKQIVDENISKLFWALLPKTPVAVEEGSLEYKVNESCVKILWRRKYKHDCETPLPENLTNKPFDNVKECLHRFGLLSFSGYMYDWFPDSEKNPTVEGITFVIETECIVPELSRTETVKAQELIEEAYRTYTVHSVMDLYKAVK
jgi:hypothetical protein